MASEAMMPVVASVGFFDAAPVFTALAIACGAMALILMALFFVGDSGTFKAKLKGTRDEAFLGVSIGLLCAALIMFAFAVIAVAGANREIRAAEEAGCRAILDGYQADIDGEGKGSAAENVRFLLTARGVPEAADVLTLIEGQGCPLKQMEAVVGEWEEMYGGAQGVARMSESSALDTLADSLRGGETEGPRGR